MTLTVFEKHQLKIARDTLKYGDTYALIMGGPNLNEAREIVHNLTSKEKRSKKK